MTVWAPFATTITLVTGLLSPPDTLDPSSVEEFEMLTSPDGTWVVPDGSAMPPTTSGTRYGFRIDDGPIRPDPRAARLPEGVHGLAAFDISPTEPTRPTPNPTEPVIGDIRGAVVYELHVGTFTPAGTLDAAINRLDHLVDLGVDFVELMPVNAFNGDHNWGYDGVGWFAVHEAYGGPAGLRRFVSACHAAGLGVVLDVVYNHLGPSGNHLPEFGPYLGAGSNNWGSSVNLSGPDSDEVRAFIIDSALRWFTDFGIDALRLDAVHAFVDDRAIHLLEELATATDALAVASGRRLALIAESDLNDPRLISGREVGGYGLTAQWDDDVHHAIHTAVSGERQGYYADFGSLATLAKVYAGGFLHDGSYSSFRRRHHGRPIPTDRIPAATLVAYTCNHDQIGNRAIGDRPSAYLDAGQLAIKAALVLLSPFTPMLFMGEEWGADTPFQYFTSHPEPELGAATAAGRRAEFAEHGWDSDDVPDPQDPDTFRRSKLDWSELEESGHRRLLDFYRALIALRKNTPALRATTFDSVSTDHDEAAGWFAMRRGEWTVLCVLAPGPIHLPEHLDVEMSWKPVDIGVDGIDSPGHNVVIGRRRTDG